MEQPSIGLLKTIKAGFTEQTVKPGSHVSFTVQKQIGDHSWIVRMLGREIRVVSDLQLKTGAHLKATVQFESGKLLLKIDQQSHAINTVLHTSSLPDTENSRMIIQAFIAQGLPLREEHLKSALKLFSQLETKNQSVARLIAVIHDKGLLLTSEQLRRIQSYVWGEDPEQQHQSNDQEGNSHNRQSGHKEGSEQRRRREKHSEQHKNKIKNRIQEYAAHKGTESSLLQLFNHKQASHQNWIIIPLSFKGYRENDVPDTGVLRLQVTKNGVPAQFTLTLKYVDEAEWHFTGKIGSTSSKIRVYSSNHNKTIRPDAIDRMNQKILSKLQKKLNNLPFEIDDTIREASEFNPFGTEAGSLLKRVDTTA